MIQAGNLQERKKLDEIAQRLTLEPQIREMYVEGIFDRDFYRLALKALGISDVQVYPIDTVQISPELLKSLDLTDGNRQRVEAAAIQLKEKTGIHGQVLFLIDADLDYLLDEPIPASPLARTDGCSAEIIMWRKDYLEHFFSIALARQNSSSEVSEIMPFVESIVTQVSIFRAAKQKAEKNWTLVDLRDCFSKQKKFSLQTYSDKIASRNNCHKEITEKIAPLISEICERAKGLNVGRKMHGHDLLAVLAKKMQLNGFEHGCLENPDELGRLMMASLDWSMVITDRTLDMLRKKFPPLVKRGR